MLVDNIGGMRYNITEENKNAGMAEPVALRAPPVADEASKSEV